MVVEDVEPSPAHPHSFSLTWEHTNSNLPEDDDDARGHWRVCVASWEAGGREGTGLYPYPMVQEILGTVDDLPLRDRGRFLGLGNCVARHP